MHLAEHTTPTAAGVLAPAEGGFLPMGAVSDPTEASIESGGLVFAATEVGERVSAAPREQLGTLVARLADREFAEPRPVPHR